ncbi:MAG: large subunit ribosomal protein [Bacillota bacterium]|nr:large subunit ribosomal protein [Bacillota bacterium]MDK2856704.1 large subunit ribosomal protein [Bacillota bacterium]MDK2924528.1 large subunit ribosomal protein [Bacillota bacterium]
MPRVPVYNLMGETVGEIELADHVFAVPMNSGLIHQAVVRHLANRRRGTADTKTRAEVSGGGRKPWRQKGTGRARHGSIRSPLWRHGGVVFGPHPRSYAQDMPRKMRRLALKMALSEKVRNGELTVVEDLKLPAPKTKEMVKVLSNLGAPKKAFIVTPEPDEVVYRSSRNLPGVLAGGVHSLNVYDVLKYDRLILTKEAVAKVEEVLG